MVGHENPRDRSRMRTVQEKLNGMRGGDYWTPSDHPVDNDFSNIDVIQYLEDDELVADGGQTPEGYFDVLYSADATEPDYAIACGGVFDYLTQDCRTSQKDALQVTRKLHKGEVEEAEEMFEELLEGDQ